MNGKPAVFLIAVTLVFAGGTASAGPADQAVVTVSIPSLRSSAKERIVRFEIHVQSGRIARIEDLPIGWEICINNDASWNTVMKGSCSVGAAALSADFFKNFLTIHKYSPLQLPFEVQGEIVVTEDFATERRIK